MKYLENYDGHSLRLNQNWTSTPTYSNDFDVQYTSKDKIYYGVHTVKISRNGFTTEVKAKFDTGARSSSIDFKVAKKLGISDAIIEKCKELDNIEVPKNLTKDQEKKYEKEIEAKLKKEFPEIASTQISKSSSGFSIRAYIEVNIQYSGRNINTQVNLRDRKGLSCEMLVGLKDML